MGKHRLPLSHCLRCGNKLDAASSGEGDEELPAEGDLSLCIYCGHLATYKADLTLRLLSDAELDELMRDAEMADLVLNMRRAIHVANTD